MNHIPQNIDSNQNAGGSDAHLEVDENKMETDVVKQAAVSMLLH